MTIPFKLPLFVFLFFVLSMSNPVVAQTDSATVELNIFPNPNRGIFYITMISEGSYESRLYSMDGRLVKMLDLQNGLNYVSMQVPAGIYILEVGEKEAQQQFKIMVK